MRTFAGSRNGGLFALDCICTHPHSGEYFFLIHHGVASLLIGQTLPGKPPIDKCAKYPVLCGVGLLLVIMVPDLHNEVEPENYAFNIV